MTRIRKHSTRARSLPRFVLAALAAGALLVPIRAGHAAATPEQACQNGRYAAAVKYNACAQKTVGKRLAGGVDVTKLNVAVSKCRLKYAGAWAKLAAKAAGTGAPCDTTRFTDNGTTVTDNLTGLQWEKKTDDATVHDKDNRYTWSTTPPAADGTAFANFLGQINFSAFAGHNDWRLPTIYELQTIVPEAYPCTTSPCIDPIFGPTDFDGYWSATTYAATPMSTAWIVDQGFGGFVFDVSKLLTIAARAVRGGL